MVPKHSNPFAVPRPTGWFHPRCRAPLAQRWGAVAEYVLSRRKQPRLAPKKSGSGRYLTMAARAHWLLLRESLVSLHRAWEQLPSVTVVSDGSWNRAEFAEAFDFWPGNLQVLLPEEILQPLANDGKKDLVALARQHPLGLKLAAVVFAAKDEPVLFSDSDILWFSDPQKILAQRNGRPGPAATVESARSYNEELVRVHAPELLAAPGINTGCIYLHGELCPPDFLQALLTTALENPRHNFNEQSIIAAAVQRHGERLPAQFCMVDFADANSWRRRLPWREGFHARHYVNWMRHQFYRDAWALRRATD